MTYYKATKMDGTDFYTGKIDYTKVPLPKMSGKGEFPGTGWLHLATTPTECVGASWPCRLFEIEPSAGAVIYGDAEHPHKIGASEAYVTREIESWKFFGPQGKEVVALIERAKTLSRDEITKISLADSAAYSAAYSAARWAARLAAYSAARWAAYSAVDWTARWTARSVADSVHALIVRNKISKEHYDTLTIPWRSAIGPIHPDDIDVRKPNFDQEINQVQDALDNLRSAIKKGSL